MLETWLDQVSSREGRSESDIVRQYGIQETDNLAPLAVFLCSDAASAISGRIFEVAGDRIVAVSPPARGQAITRGGSEWTFEEIEAGLPGLTG